MAENEKFFSVALSVLFLFFFILSLFRGCVCVCVVYCFFFARGVDVAVLRFSYLPLCEFLRLFCVDGFSNQETCYCYGKEVGSVGE